MQDLNTQVWHNECPMAFDIQLAFRVSTTEKRLRMSNWITDEANSNNDRERKEEYENRLVQQSNYWARIVRQVEADVNALNEHDYWRRRLTLVGFPLQFRPNTFGEGYQVSKSGYPAVLITFTNTADSITIKRDFNENPVASEFKNETLRLKVIGDNIAFITQDNQSLIVPEDVSRYILKAAIESAKITKPVEP